MAPSVAEHGGYDPPSHGPARPHARRHGADPGHPEQGQRGPARQEGAEHGDGAAAARPLPRPPAFEELVEEAGAYLRDCQLSLERDYRLSKWPRYVWWQGPG